MAGVWAAFAVLFVAWGMLTLQYPFTFDHGTHAYQGWVVATGGRPYVDVFDSRGPFVMVAYALAYHLAGHHTWGVWVVNCAFVAVGVTAAARVVVRDTGSHVAAFLAATLIVLWIGATGAGAMAQPDGWVGFLLAAGLAPILGRRAGARTTLPYWACGAVIGVLTLAKPFYLGFLLVPYAAAVGDGATRGPARTSALRCVAASTAAAVLAIAAGFGWLAARGAGSAFLDLYLGYNRAVYAPSVNLAGRIAGLVHSAVGDPTIGWGVIAGGLAGVFVWADASAGAHTRRTVRLTLLWLAGAVACVLLQARFWRWHWEVAIPPAAILVGLATARAVQRGHLAGAEASARVERAGWNARTIAAWAALAAAALLIVRAAIPSASHALVSLRVALGQRPVAAVWDRHTAAPGQLAASSFRAERDVARYLAARTATDDRLFVWGYASSIAFFAQRRITSRFEYPDPLVSGATTSYRPRFRQELLAAFDARPPCYVVVDAGLEDGRGSTAPFPALAERVARSYRAESQIERFRLYRADATVLGACAAQARAGATGATFGGSD